MRTILSALRRFLILLVCCGGALVPIPVRAADTLKVIVVDGDEAANIVAQRIAAEPAIEVRDKDDRRVPGAVVRFVIRKTRDRLIATFGNGQAEVRTLTDYSGRASVNAVSPVEPGSFQIDVEVSYRGQTGKAVIRQTNFATSADAKSAGREPGKSTNPTQTATTAAATGAAATTAATTTATTAAVSAGGGMSKLAVIGLVAGGAAGAGAAVVLSQKEGEPAGAVGAVVASQAIGVEGATPFTFSVQATGFDAASVTYRWEFGDGATSTEPAPTHIYASAGTFAVVVTVSDPRQSARSEMSVTVRTLTGTWLASAVGSSTSTMQLTQTGSSISGSVTVEFTVPAPLTYSNCVISGTVQSGVTAPVTLNSPPCRHPTAGRTLEPVTYNLTVATDGQTMSGTETGPLSGTSPISLRRQ
jgi:PKD repeat protein